MATNASPAVEIDARKKKTITVTIPAVLAQEVALVLWRACQDFADDGASPDQYAALHDLTNSLASTAAEALQ